MEQILGGLLFSSNDILEDVLNNLHNINDDFIAFLEKKVDASRDMDERTGLASLKETIQVVLDRVKEAEGEEGEGVEDELTLEQGKRHANTHTRKHANTRHALRTTHYALRTTHYARQTRTIYVYTYILSNTFLPIPCSLFPVPLFSCSLFPIPPFPIPPFPRSPIPQFP
jgi:hypothetical protein